VLFIGGLGAAVLRGDPQIIVLRVATGQDVEINVVADHSAGHHDVLFVLVRELDKQVVGFGVDDGAVFNPADLVLLGPDLEEAAAVFQDIEGLAVGDLGHAIRDGGYSVLEVHLPGGDIDRLVQRRVEPCAAADEREKAHGQISRERRQRGLVSPDTGDEGDGGDWRSREHSRWRSS